MEAKREKDNLTDLVSEISSSDGGSDNGGKVSLLTGEMVKLDFKAERRKLDNIFKTDAEKVDFLLQMVIQLQKENAELKKDHERK
jgi:hypothetical protein